MNQRRWREKDGRAEDGREARLRRWRPLTPKHVRREELCRTGLGVEGTTESQIVLPPALPAVSPPSFRPHAETMVKTHLLMLNSCKFLSYSCPSYDRLN